MLALPEESQRDRVACLQAVLHSRCLTICQKNWSATILRTSKNAQDAAGSLAFVQVQRSIISALILELVVWSGNAVRDRQLLGPYAEVASSYMMFGRKDLEQDDNFGSSELAQQTHILRNIFKHMRIAAMSKEFSSTM